MVMESDMQSRVTVQTFLKTEPNFFFCNFIINELVLSVKGQRWDRAIKQCFYCGQSKVFNQFLLSTACEESVLTHPENPLLKFS